MPQGLTPARGEWEYRRIATTSTATFRKGSLVGLSGARLAKVYNSADSGYLGIAMGASTDSMPNGYVTVAVPRPGCTAYADCFTGMAQSVMSLGQAHGICPGNASDTSTYVSFVTTLHTSVFSQVCTIVGPVDAATSRVEIAFIQNEATFYSTSSVSIV